MFGQHWCAKFCHNCSPKSKPCFKNKLWNLKVTLETKKTLKKIPKSELQGVCLPETNWSCQERIFPLQVLLLLFLFSLASEKQILLGKVKWKESDKQMKLPLLSLQHPQTVRVYVDTAIRWKRERERKKEIDQNMMHSDFIRKNNWIHPTEKRGKSWRK